MVLFDYDSSSPITVAQTLTVDPSATTTALTAAPVSVPAPLAGWRARLRTRWAGPTFSEYYGQMAASVGAKLSAATDLQTTQQATLAQAQSLRQQSSGVSLDQEAMTLIQFQSAYDACSKLVTTLDQITQDTIDMLQVFT